ncbi:nitrate reductase [Alicycliphilus sp. B1]|nr:nitrate reductase [Alicycliphilus sp. B1]
MYLLPACTQFETSGSATASNRSLQWREKVIEPLWESRSDHMIMYQLAQKLGFGKELVKNYQMQKVKGMDEPVPEDILREVNRCCWTIGYTGQSPERLKAHMRHMSAFDVKTLKCTASVVGQGVRLRHEGRLLRPAPGLAGARRSSSTRARPTCTRPPGTSWTAGATSGPTSAWSGDGVNLLAEDGSHSLGADITTGYPEFDHVLLKKLGWWDDLTEAEKKAADGKNWKTDPSGGIIRVVMKVHGCYPVRQRQGARRGVELPRRDSAAPRAHLLARAPTWRPSTPRTIDKNAFWRMPTLYKSLQEKNVADRLYEKFPLILSSGRLVEYEGGGEETRSNPWLAELAAGGLRRDQPQGRGQPGHTQWRPGLAQHAHGRSPERAGPGDRARGTRHLLDAVPLLRAAGRARTCWPTTPRARTRWCAARRSTPAPPMATTA